MKDDALSSSAPEVGLPDAWPPRVIGFDGDDTLWHSESLFSMTQGRFRMLLMHHVDLPSTLIDARLAETVQRNLSVYGHGIKGFVLSMVETAITVTDGRIPAQDIHTILSFGRTMLEYPVELAEGAREVLETLRARDHELWLIADGDVFDQESKIARSGLAPLFHHIAIVTEKSEDTYRRLLDQHGVLPEEFAMVGNAVRSDVLPVIEIGACAYHVPDPVTSGSRKAEVGTGDKGAYRAIPNLGALLQVLDTPEDETA
jgi:putative hydrolase of the HAD superfamily